MTIRNTTIASVIALTMGTAAYAEMTSMESIVREALDDHGYSNVALTDLTETEMASIYTTATGESYADVEQVLRGIDIAKAPDGSVGTETLIVIPQPADMTPDATKEVQDELMKRGYSEAQIASLTEDEVANLYVTMTSADSAGAVDEVLSGIFDS